MRVAVTGASGFVGSALCRSQLTKGHHVRGVVKNGTPPEGVEVVRIGDLVDTDALAAAFRGAETVIHLAGRAHVSDRNGPEALNRFRQVNVRATAAVIAAAKRAGVSRLIHASSVKAVTESSGPEGLTESVSPQPVDPYGISKLEAESLVESACDGEFHGTILRLPLVYGPGMRANMLELFRVVDRGLPLPLGSIRNVRTILFVGNLVAAIEAVLAGEQKGCELFFLGDDPPLSTPDLVAAIAAALSVSVRVIPFPVTLLRLAASLGDRFSHLLPAAISSEAVRRLTDSLVVDSSRFRSRYDFVPPYQLPEGLTQTADWYRADFRGVRPAGANCRC